MGATSCHLVFSGGHILECGSPLRRQVDLPATRASRQRGPPGNEARQRGPPGNEGSCHKIKDLEHILGRSWGGHFSKMWPPLNGEGLPATRACRQRGPPGRATLAGLASDPGGAGERPWRGPAFWYSTRGHILGKGPSRDRPPALSRMAVSMAVTDASSLSRLARLSFFRKQPRKELPYLRLLNEYIQLPYLCLLNEEDFWPSGTGYPGTGPEPAVCMGLGSIPRLVPEWPLAWP